jgi:hypothetical protein
MNAGRPASPVIIHYGFCESKESMAQKNAYYLNRGEVHTRPATTLFRRAALEGRTPTGCKVYPYRGHLPFEPRESAPVKLAAQIR